MRELSKEEFINLAGKGRYLNADAPEFVIKYITRTNGLPKDDLVVWGGIGVAEYLGTETVIEQIYHVQKMRKRRGNFGRYIDHEIYSLSTEEEATIRENNIDIDKIARKMAYDFYDNDHCQVVYGVHRTDKEEKHMHIHFPINTVDYVTTNKRRENKRQTEERGKRLQKIVDDEINENVSDK